MNYRISALAVAVFSLGLLVAAPAQAGHHHLDVVVDLGGFFVHPADGHYYLHYNRPYYRHWHYHGPRLCRIDHARESRRHHHRRHYD